MGNMDLFFLYSVAGVLLGLSATFYIITGMLKKSNEIGNTKGDRFDYACSFDVLKAKNQVSRFFDIDKM